MDVNFALVGLVVLAAALLAIGLYLDTRHRSHGIPVIREVYRPARGHRYRW